MKKLIGIILVVVALTGCKPIIDEVLDDDYDSRYSGFNIYYGDFSSIKTENDVHIWINSHVRYVASDDLQSPAACVASGHGDCEEKALLYLDIMYVVFHKKGDLCLVKATARTIEAGGNDINHAVVRYGSTIIEPATGREVSYEVCYSYSFDHIFK